MGIKEKIEKQKRGQNLICDWNLALRGENGQPAGDSASAGDIIQQI